MGSEIIVAALISAAATAGSTAYTTEEQKRAREDAEDKQAEALREAEVEKERIARLTKPEQQVAGDKVKFGVDRSTDVGALSNFLVPKVNGSQLGSASNKSGLGA